MAKSKKTGEEKKASFEERLQLLEELGDKVRKSDVSLDEAIKAFEEGIKLAKDLEKDLEKIESRIEILMTGTETGSESDLEDDSDESFSGKKYELGLFDDDA